MRSRIVIPALLTACVAVGVLSVANLTSGHTADAETVFVPVTPCRLIDTRADATNNVGPRDTPIGQDETALFNAHDGKDADSACSVPSTATAISANAVAVNPTAQSYVTLYPSDVPNPGTANLNFVANQAPTPNAAIIPLAADGGFNVYNASGSVNIIIDVTGYYQPSTGDDTPGAIPTGHSIAAVDTSSFGGLWTSVAVGTNGNPIISYHDAATGELRVAACNDPTCTTALVTPVDSAGTVGEYSSIAIGDDGNPVISYFDNDLNEDLKVAACNDPLCATPATITTLDSSGVTGLFTSIAIGDDGNPVISYRDGSGRDLNVAACNNPSCTSATITPVDTDAHVGVFTSIAIGADGNPVISYYADTAEDLRVAACNDSACTSPATISTLDSAGDVGEHTSITIGTDGNPVISYKDATADDLKVAACTDPACTNPPIISTLDSAGDVGEGTSITIGVDGHPVIAYHDATGRDLRVAACTDTACTNTPTIATLDTVGWVGLYPAIVIGTDGGPVISYWDTTNGDPKAAICGNTTCAPFEGHSR